MIPKCISEVPVTQNMTLYFVHLHFTLTFITEAFKDILFFQHDFLILIYSDKELHLFLVDFITILAFFLPKLSPKALNKITLYNQS